MGALSAAAPMFRARRPFGAVSVIVAAAVLAIANGLVSSDLVNALVYERGPLGAPARNAEACGELAEGVRLAGDRLGDVRVASDQPPEYAAAVQADLSDGCGGEGRDLRALATMRPARS